MSFPLPFPASFYFFFPLCDVAAPICSPTLKLGGLIFEEELAEFEICLPRCSFILISFRIVVMGSGFSRNISLSTSTCKKNRSLQLEGHANITKIGGFVWKETFFLIFRPP